MGPSSEFKEKDGYKPNVKLDYIDDEGHVLNAKEAFRLVDLQSRHTSSLFIYPSLLFFVSLHIF